MRSEPETLCAWLLNFGQLPAELTWVSKKLAKKFARHQEKFVWEMDE